MLASIVFEDNGINYYNYSFVLHNFKPGRLLLLLILVHFYISNVTTSTSDEVLSNSIRSKDDEYRLQYAAQMLSYMNLSVDPCENFYEYACGNWKNLIKEQQTEQKRVNVLDIEYKLAKVVESMLRKDSHEIVPEYAEQFELAKKFFNQCLKTKLYPMRKAPEYLRILREIGGFPALDPEWDASQFSWLKMSAHMNRYGLESLIKEEIISEYPFMPYFPLPSLGFDVELHHDNMDKPVSRPYLMNKKRMQKILALYGIDKQRINIIIEDIFEFIKMILNLMTHFEEDESRCEELSETLNDDLEEDVIYQQWLTYFDIVWQGKFQTLTADNRPCLYFYKELNRIIERHKEATANYLSLKFLYHMDAHLQHSKYHKDYCLRTVKSDFNFLFDHIFMKLYFNREISDDVRRMIVEIQQSLRHAIQEVDWMDKMTRKAALRKESTMQIHVGRYEDPPINKLLLQELKNLTFSKQSYEVNRLNLMLFKSTMNRYYGLHQSDVTNHTKPMRMMLGMEINAFYYPIDNGLYIAAGVLQPPTYHPAWPTSLKYGTLGYILGHEFTHGFDEQGSNYDYTGANMFWWSNESVNHFEERAQCFIDSYSDYYVPEINRHINGVLTLNENIADAGGLKLALMAYRRFANEERGMLKSIPSTVFEEEQMPELNLSPERLFFLGAAQIWCSSYREVDYWQELSNSHTIEKYRVLGMIANNEDFREVFNCPSVDANQCKIW